MESTTTRYAPRQGDRPCVQCGKPVHPADAAQTRRRHGTAAVLCLGCLKLIEQELLAKREPSHLEVVQGLVDADPGIERPSVADAHRPGLRLSGQ